MSRKALFFDVDGTLFSETLRVVPDSAKKALAQTRKKGNLVFINSGRTYCLLKQFLEQLENDGCLCGCGTHIRVGDRVLYSHQIPHRRGNEIKKAIVAFGLDGVLEGTQACYFQKEESRIEGMRKLKESIAGSCECSPFTWDEDCYEFDKFCVFADEHSDRKGFFAFLEPDIQVIDRGNDFYECVPKGHTKATAIDGVLKDFGIGLEDAYVFGDSANDLDMFRHVPNAVLMGKHDDVLKPYATFVTKEVEDDGIEYALKSLGLL